MSASILAKLTRELSRENNVEIDLSLNKRSDSQLQYLGCGISRIVYAAQFVKSDDHISYPILVSECYIKTVQLPPNIGKRWSLVCNGTCYCSYNLNKFLGKLFNVDFRKYVVIFEIQPFYVPEDYLFTILWFNTDEIDEHIKFPIELLQWEAPVRQRLGLRYVGLLPASIGGTFYFTVLVDYVFVEVSGMPDDAASFTVQLNGQMCGFSSDRFTKRFSMGEGQVLHQTENSSLYVFALNELPNNKQYVKMYLRQCMKYLKNPNLGPLAWDDREYCRRHFQHSEQFPANVQIVESSSFRTNASLYNMNAFLWELRIRTYRRLDLPKESPFGN